MPNVETVLRDHVMLQVDCVDRLYLNGYVPALQRPEQLERFLRFHRGPASSTRALTPASSVGRGNEAARAGAALSPRTIRVST